MPDQADRLPILIQSINGASASNSGDTIKVGITAESGACADAIMTTDQGTDLMALVGAALGEARRRKTNDPDLRYLWPVRSWEIAPQRNDQMLTFAFRLTSGNEMCFQFDRIGAQSLLEGISAALGTLDSPTIPESQKH